MTTELHLEPDALEALRSALHDAVDRIIDRYRPEERSDTGVQDVVRVTRGGATESWPYRWPDGSEEVFPITRWYELDGPKGRQRVRLAWGQRSSWGRSDRRRAIVFNQLGPASSTTYYPWTEFVETDDERFAAPIPDPERPRAMITDPGRLPGRFLGATVERSDVLFESVAEGPSLRLVVAESDEETMVRHGYWVATLRRRI
jgi:hypothetical protein